MIEDNSFIGKLKRFIGKLKRFYNIKRKFDGIKYLWKNTQFQYFMKMTGTMFFLLLFMWIIFAFIILPSAETLISDPSSLLVAAAAMLFFFHLFLLYFFVALIRLIIFYYYAKKQLWEKLRFMTIKEESPNKSKYLIYLGKNFVLFPLLAILFTFLILIIPEFNLTLYSFFFLTVIAILLLQTFIIVPILSWVSVSRILDEFDYLSSIIFVVIIPLTSGLTIDIVLNIFTAYSGIATTSFISLAVILLLFIRDILDQAGDDLRDNPNLSTNLITKTIFNIYIFMSTLISLSNILGIAFFGFTMDYVAAAYSLTTQDYGAGLLWGVTIFFTICQYIGIVGALIKKR